jgi:hypothetical protein
MAAKKASTKKKSKTEESSQKHWFPTDAKPADPPAAAPKKTSPWQRRTALVNYGTIAGPCVNLRDEFNKYIDKNHKKLSETQRLALWKVVGMRLLKEDSSRLSEIIASEIKNPSINI